jgi:hypothetical protein
VAYLTSVKSNHTFKFGAEFKTEGSIAPAIGNDGSYTFAADQTGQPFQQTAVGGANVGLAYASFLLGLVNNGNVTLTGVVDSAMDRNVIYDRTMEVRNVFSVTNDLQVQ